MSRLPESHVSELPPSLWGVLADLPMAASTGPAFGPPLLVPDGPTAALNPGETSCLACETPHPAAETQKQKSHVNFYKISQQSSYCMRHLLHSYWLLLAEKKTAELRIGSWVCEAEYRTLGLGLSALCDLVGWSTADWRLLVGWSSCSHRHLKESLSYTAFISHQKASYEQVIKKTKIGHPDTKIKNSCRFQFLFVGFMWSTGAFTTLRLVLVRLLSAVF